MFIESKVMLRKNATQANSRTNPRNNSRETEEAQYLLVHGPYGTMYLYNDYDKWSRKKFVHNVVYAYSCNSNPVVCGSSNYPCTMRSMSIVVHGVTIRAVDKVGSKDVVHNTVVVVVNSII